MQDSDKTVEEKIKEIIYKNAHKAGMSDNLEDGQIIGFKTGAGLELDACASDLEKFVAEVSAASRREALEQTRDEIQNLINVSNENASTDWYDGLRAARSVAEELQKES